MISDRQIGNIGLGCGQSTPQVSLGGWWYLSWYLRPICLSAVCYLFWQVWCSKPRGNHGKEADDTVYGVVHTLSPLLGGVYIGLSSSSKFLSLIQVPSWWQRKVCSFLQFSFPSPPSPDVRGSDH